MKTSTKALSAITAGMLLAAGAASAAPVDLNGYFRSGAGTSSEGGNIVCYRLPGAIVWFRLGNECDTYVSLNFNAELGKVDGSTFKAHFTYAQGTQGLANWEQSSPSLREAYVDILDFGAGMGMPALKGSTLWAGKRFYKNPDIHMLDYTYWEPAQGPGVGLDGVDVGIGKLSYAILRIGDFTGYGINTSLGGFNPDLIGGGSRTATVHDLRLQDVAVNPGGKMTFGIDLVQKNNRKNAPTSTNGTTTVDNTAGKNGTGITVTHAQDNLFGLGGGNTLGLQVAKDAVALKGFGFAGSNDSRKEFLLFDHWYMAPAGSALQATSTFGYRDAKINSSKVKEFWIGTRPVWNLNNIWSLVSEVGYQQVKVDSQATRKLAKATFGTQFSMGPGVWARPSIRLFGTYAKWNGPASAAGAVACSGRDCGAVADGFTNKTTGFSYGAQVEAWF
jgi:maltoporin